MVSTFALLILSIDDESLECTNDCCPSNRLELSRMGSSGSGMVT